MDMESMAASEFQTSLLSHTETTKSAARQSSAATQLVEVGELPDQFDGLPEPVLCSINDETKKQNLIQIDQENWDEGTDSKSKAFKWLREQKDIMFDQNREWVKFRKIFKGLKRTHKRAHKPNKLTEYDIPVDTRVRGVTGAKGAECGFDPDEVL